MGVKSLQQGLLNILLRHAVVLVASIVATPLTTIASGVLGDHVEPHSYIIHINCTSCGTQNFKWSL